jgi:hypothetical protein
LCLAPAAILACGDTSSDSGASGTDSASGATSSSASASTGGSGSASASGTSSTSDGTSATSGSGATSATTGSGSGGGPKFDVGSIGDLPDDTCMGMCGAQDYSYIWIANSSESTVSKINTRTLVEEGRYATRDTPGNPSRTSVSVDGRAVAVANRNGGVVKIWARPEDCKGANTSTGANDVKAWGTDDCVAWYTPFPEARSQRPVAWTTGTKNPVTCQWEDQKIWTAEGRSPSDPGGVGGFCEDDKVHVHLLDGDTGAIEESLVLPYPCTTFGVYGGVVDANNDLWLTRLFEGNPGAIRVDFDTLTYEPINPFYGYGITVDHKGRIWGGTGAPGRWDPTLQIWETITGSINNSGVGLAEDGMNRMWVGIVGGIQAVDVDTLQLGPAVMFSGEMIQSKGISVDVDGYIWAVPDAQDRAYRVNPTTLTYDQIGGLVGAYTYSDMTGGALKSVACNPPQG